MRIYLTILFTILALTSSQRFLEENESFEDKIRTFNTKDLKTIALGLEKVDRAAKHIQALGGLHDYIFRLRDDQIISIIFDYTSVYTDYRSISKLQKDFLNTPSLQLNNSASDDDPDKDLKDKLNNESRFTLISIALEFERLERIAKHQENLLGGLHDYINKLSNSSIVDIIVSYSKKLTDYNTYDKIFALRKSTKIDEQEIERRLRKYDKTKLMHIAISADSYDREHSEIQRMGGLHDYVFRLSKDELIKVIITYCKKWPELSQEQYFKGLENEKEDSVHNIIGGFEDYSWRLDIEDLKRCALAAENYDRKKLKIKLLGGLHDYIDSLNKDQIHEILIEYVHKHQELRNPGVLEKLANIPQGGFQAYLEKITDDESLRGICIALDEYDREVRKIHLIGGFHDYVLTLTRQQLIDFINNKAEYYPNIREVGIIEQLVQKYNSK